MNSRAVSTLPNEVLKRTRFPCSELESGYSAGRLRENGRPEFSRRELEAVWVDAAMAADRVLQLFGAYRLSLRSGQSPYLRSSSVMTRGDPCDVGKYESAGGDAVMSKPLNRYHGEPSLLDHLHDFRKIEHAVVARDETLGAALPESLHQSVVGHVGLNEPRIEVIERPDVEFGDVMAERLAEDWLGKAIVEDEDGPTRRRPAGRHG